MSPSRRRITPSQVALEQMEFHFQIPFFQGYETHAGAFFKPSRWPALRPWIRNLLETINNFAVALLIR